MKKALMILTIILVVVALKGVSLRQEKQPTNSDLPNQESDYKLPNINLNDGLSNTDFEGNLSPEEDMDTIIAPPFMINETTNTSMGPQENTTPEQITTPTENSKEATEPSTLPTTETTPNIDEGRAGEDEDM